MLSVMQMFRQKKIITPRETSDGVLTVSALGRHLNDIMEANAESLGAGTDYHLSRRLAWVLTEYQLLIDRLPRVDEEVQFGTEPYAFKRMFGYRRYRIETLDGSVLLEGKGKFVLMDIDRKRPVRPSEELLAKFEGARIGETLDFPKWESPQSAEPLRSQLTITREDIDVNGHVNNARYIHHASELLERTAGDSREGLRQLNVRYRKELLEGDQVELQLHRGNDSCSVLFFREQEKVADIVFFYRP